MDQKEKQILVTSISMIAIFVCYSLYVYHNYIVGNLAILDDFRFWGKTFLILIPVTIVSQIIIHILFAIFNKIATNEDMDTKSDERDKLIDLKAIQISHWVFTLGFLVAMASLAFGMRPYVMFITLFASGLVSSLISEIAKIYFYRKGV
jgi:hypothetical protein